MTSKEPNNPINVKELMKGGKQVNIQHEERLYRLSITRKGNLILTKAEEEQLIAEATKKQSY